MWLMDDIKAQAFHEVQQLLSICFTFKAHKTMHESPN